MTALARSGNWMRGAATAGPAAHADSSAHFDYSDWLGQPARAAVRDARVRAATAGYEQDICTSLPYGADLSCAGGTDYSPMHFTGQVRDAATGLDHFSARNYTSAWGRWMSPDWSASPAAVPYGNYANPQSLDLYVLALDDPASNVDISGHACGTGPEVHGGAKSPNGHKRPCAEDGNKKLEQAEALAAQQERAESEQALSARGAAFIQAAEGGFHAAAYRDSAGHLTIGYGHEIKVGEHLADPMTQAQGEALFQSDARGAVAEVNYGLNGYPQKQNQFDALVDLAFNAGAIAVRRGNEMMSAIHAGHVAAGNFAQYDLSRNPKTGRLGKSSGLLSRREAEWILYSTGIY
ncbi:MAG: glycoside hydrolase family protein [Terriglobales bacterium]